MALFEGKTPAERNKMIAAIVLSLLAFIFVVRMLFGSSGPSATSVNANSGRRQRATNQQRQQQQQQQADADETDPEKIFGTMTQIVCCPVPYGGADAGRNIFAFYFKPTPPPGSGVPTPPPATPTPTPPLVLASLTPQSVYARTAGFTLQVSGDKFGPGARVYVDGQELETQYRSMQQLSANVPASVIASPGQRLIKVQTPDGKLYSNEQQLNVMQPPQPTYTYVGFLKRARFNTAVVKDQKGELYSVRDGDLIEGRFRVTEISERGIEVVDKDLNIKHTMPYVAGPNNPAMGRAPGSIQPPPPPASEDGDEEP
jgi:hypothetical protein